MKKQLTKEDIKELLNSNQYELTITRPSKDITQVRFTPKKQTCFGCNTLTPTNDLLIRLDARVVNLALPKKFCRPCAKNVDDLLFRLKKKSTTNYT